LIETKQYAALAGLDRRVAEIEAEWGLDRLPQLVDGELGLRFQRARAALNDAINSGDAGLIAQKAANALRGWEAVLEAARAAGHTPEGDPDRVWLAETDEGRKIAVVRTSADAQAVPDGYQAYSLDEIGRLIDAQWSLPNAVKAAWPGATISKSKVPKGGDEVPF
jgi:hypothetical protein